MTRLASLSEKDGNLLMFSRNDQSSCKSCKYFWGVPEAYSSPNGQSSMVLFY